MNLSSKKCIPCEVGGKALTSEEATPYLKDLSKWEADSNNKKITRTVKFKDFKEALTFVNKVGALAESEGHHPDIVIHYNKVTLELSTHAVGGLTENDFILATKIDQIA